MNRRAAMSGSSPRVRGTLLGDPRGIGHLRFIPARAGNSIVRLCAVRLRAVHPRACGELSVTSGCKSDVIGSSPRVRGTPRGSGQGGPGCRFIPARAGNSDEHPQCCGCHAVHPRACGELSASSGTSASGNGSSPRVRGTPSPPLPRRHNERFIPARAGNSAETVVGHIEVRGSSPRVRGTPIVNQNNCQCCRFIPARAGNSPSWSNKDSGPPVHPRACGELHFRRSHK